MLAYNVRVLRHAIDSRTVTIQKEVEFDRPGERSPE